MIRINLLNHLPAPTEGLQAMLHPGRSGGFISRRETILGGLFLLMAFAILGSQLWMHREPAEEPAAQSARAPVTKVEANPNNPSGPGYRGGQGGSPPFATKPGTTKPETAPPAAEAAPESAPEPAPKPTTQTAASRPSPEPAKPDAAARSPLTAIRVTPIEDGVDIFLPIEGSPRVKTFRVDDPSRVVFDIPGATLEAPNEQRVQRIDSPWITRVRVAQNTIEPPLVRVVLEVPDFPKTSSSVSEVGIAIRVRRP